MATTAGWNVSVGECLPNAVSVDARASRVAGGGNPAGIRIFSKRVLMQATSIACLLAKIA